MPSRSWLGLPVISLAGNYRPFRSWLIAEDAPPETAPALVRFLAEETATKAFRVGPVESNLEVIRSLKEAFVATGWKFCQISRATDYLIDLPADPSAYPAMLPRHKFKRIRSKKNRVKRQGEVRIACHRDLANPEASRSTSLWILYLDHQPIAFSLMLHSEECSYSIVGAYDETFQNYSPGTMVDFEAINDCLERGTKIINMG